MKNHLNNHAPFSKIWFTLIHNYTTWHEFIHYQIKWKWNMTLFGMFTFFFFDDGNRSKKIHWCQVFGGWYQEGGIYVSMKMRTGRRGSWEPLFPRAPTQCNALRLFSSIDIREEQNRLRNRILLTVKTLVIPLVFLFYRVIVLYKIKSENNKVLELMINKYYSLIKIPNF